MYFLSCLEIKTIIIIIDKWGGNDSFGDRAVTQLHSFTESLALEDFYRVSNPSGKHKCSPFAYSDHHLIKLQVTFGLTNPRGRGVWKFNTATKKRKFLRRS